MNKRTLFYLSSCLLLGGCMVGPDYQTPENTTPDEWASTPFAMDFELSDTAPIVDWWKLFNDSLLDKYIEMAACNNKNLLVAEANILQARALRMVAASSLYPQITGDLNGTKTYFSKNGPVFQASSFTQGTSAATGLPFVIQVPQIQPLYNALFDASWEIDLFGKTRRGVQAAQATYESMIEQRNDTLVSLEAEVARNYMEVRSFQEQAILLEENIELLEKNAEIVRISLEQGLDNKLDYESIEAQLASARSELPNVVAQIYRGTYTLSILTGNLPETLLEEMLPQKPLPKPPSEIIVGIRSDLLRRRPDIRSAERQLASATANIGVAVASFFPSITLAADAGFQSLKLSNLFQMHSRTWSYGGNINIPIFEGGNLVGNLRASEAVASAATYTYQQTVLTALQDTESAIASYAQDLKTSEELFNVTDRNQKLVDLTRERYTKGLVGLIDLLTSQRQLVTAKLNQLTSDTTTLLDLISLYKALGGGWQPVEEEPDLPEQ